MSTLPADQPSHYASAWSKSPADPVRIFHIPNDVKYLEAEQLTALTEAFRAWREFVAKRAAGCGWPTCCCASTLPAWANFCP
jgi:hypothetical protein